MQIIVVQNEQKYGGAILVFNLLLEVVGSIAESEYEFIWHLFRVTLLVYELK